jgi:hypothetical protein
MSDQQLRKLNKMATIYEVTVKAGVYQKDGQEKIRYQRIGSVIETKKGPMLKLDQMPLVEGGWTGWAYLFEPQADGYKAPVKQSSPRAAEFSDDSIPF